MDTETSTDGRLLERVGKLLRQSEAASTEEEGLAYAAKAQKLISAHSIDEAVARARLAATEARAVPTQRIVSIGERGKRGLSTYVALFLAVARANDVECNIAHNSTYVSAFGFAADIDMCELVYSHLAVQMVRASNAYLKAGDYRSETRASFDTRSWERVERPVAGVTARKSFHEAFAKAVGARLAAARRHAVEQAETDRLAGLWAQAVLAAAPSRDADLSGLDEAEPASTETGLALKAKEVEVSDYYKEHSTARGSWRGGSPRCGAAHSAAGARAGRQAGDNARLSIHREIG